MHPQGWVSCVIPQRQKPAKASHAKGDVCVFLARDQQIGPSKVPLCVFFRSLWLEDWPKVWGILEATQSPGTTYSSWRCKDPMDFSIFPRWHVKCRTLFAWCLHFPNLLLWGPVFLANFKRTVHQVCIACHQPSERRNVEKGRNLAMDRCIPLGCGWFFFFPLFRWSVVVCSPKAWFPRLNSRSKYTCFGLPTKFPGC